MSTGQHKPPHVVLHHSSTASSSLGKLSSQKPVLRAHFTACCSDKANLLTETLEKQFELVKLRTSNNGTYNQGSHAKQYGTLSIDEEPVADYLGALNTGGGVGVGKVLRPSLPICTGRNPSELAALAGRRSCCLQGQAAGMRPVGTPVAAPGLWNFSTCNHVDCAIQR